MKGRIQKPNSDVDLKTILNCKMKLGVSALFLFPNLLSRSNSSAPLYDTFPDSHCLDRDKHILCCVLTATLPDFSYAT